MKLIVNEKDGCCESINIKYTPTEALIINQAMRRYVDDEEISDDDRKVMEQMLDVEPIFREIGAETEGKVMSEISETEIKKLTKEQNYCLGYFNGRSDTLNKIRNEIERLQAGHIEYKVDIAFNKIKSEDK